ncbi:hypothetical protein GY45DRAFT_1337187 [Cubamyces sp. BRFM 1775]|nr:hypothetical protein GY45DRAFT_1337187 [Cubamyces sp. BRFM 1775]
MEKPKASSNSRAYKAGSHFAKTQAQKQGDNSLGPTRGKKTRDCDVGKLTHILDLPCDLFYEVASHLRPYDILQLSRSSKELRAILLSRKSRGIWVAARRNMVPPMPDCPEEHLSEPRYAQLFYERTCDACGVNQSLDVDYALAVRFCRACWKMNVRNGGKLTREASLKPRDHALLFYLLPRGNSIWTSDDDTPGGLIIPFHQSSSDAFYEPEFRVVVKEYKRLLDSKDQAALDKYVEERKADAIRRIKVSPSEYAPEWRIGPDGGSEFHTAVLRWCCKVAEQEGAEEEQKIRERRKAIEEKLRALGYDPSEFPTDHKEFNNMVNQPRQLTTRSSCSSSVMHYGTRQQPSSGTSRKKARTRELKKLIEHSDLPLDIFYEVASYLNPVDLLQLSRASKEPRAFMLSRKSRLLWVKAFGNIVPEMPACPEHLSEPSYAHVVFERICDACGTGHAVKVDYATPVRLCSECWKSKPGAEVFPSIKYQEGKSADVGRNTEEDSIPPDFQPSPGGRWLPERQVIQTSTSTYSQRVTDIYYEPEFKSVVQNYRQLLQSKDEDMLQGFIDGRRELTTLQFKNAVPLWERKLRELQAVEDREHMKDRQLAIEEKLRELGYETSEFPMHHYDFRQERAETAFKTKWQKRIEQLRCHYAEFLQQDRDGELGKRTFPGFEDALAQAMDIVPAAEPDVDVTQGELTTFEAAVLNYADGYRAQVRVELVELVKQVGSIGAALPSRNAERTASRKSVGKGKRKASPDDDSEDLAGEEASSIEAQCALLDSHTSLFTCRLGVHAACGEVMSYLDVMEHGQHAHGSIRWSSNDVGLTQTEPTRVSALATALGLREDSTLSELRAVIHSGHPECTCRQDLHLEAIQPYQYFARLLGHVNGSDTVHQFHTMSHTSPGPLLDEREKPVR